MGFSIRQMGGDIVKQVNSKPEQHFTQPPARYSEATLIKTLEENGVGRPSTYAPTIETIQKRYYVKLVAKRFEPTELGEIVNKLIVEFFPDIVNVTFTAIVKEIGVECPNCHQGQIIERKTKRNRIFYGCNRYPDCEFTSWDKPIGRDCPKCGHYLVEKKVRGGGKQVVCSNGDYEEEKVK